MYRASQVKFSNPYLFYEVYIYSFPAAMTGLGEEYKKKPLQSGNQIPSNHGAILTNYEVEDSQWSGVDIVRPCGGWWI